MRQLGVEEELLLVDPDNGRPQAVASAALRIADSLDERTSSQEVGGEIGNELWLEQLETDTHPCHTLSELETEILSWRSKAAKVARATGAEIAAIGTSPFPAYPSMTPKPRYREIIDHFGLTAQEQLVCGCHVHVEVSSDEEGVAVIDRMKPWLPSLIALSANSPFWDGRDSGFASYRAEVMRRWPSSGPSQVFGSAARYHEVVEAMQATGVVLDEGMIYFDVRLARNYPTVEIRVGDVCMRASDTVLFAALVRGLVETEARCAAEDPTPPDLRVELERVAIWQAARAGIDGALVHPSTGQPAKAKVVIDALLEHVRPALESYHDFSLVRQKLGEVFSRGTGARAQRIAFARSNRLSDVLETAVRLTTAGL